MCVNVILGGFGVDFSSNLTRLEEGLHTVSMGLLKYGVTSYLPTLVSSSPDTYRMVWLPPPIYLLLNRDP